MKSEDKRAWERAMEEFLEKGCGHVIKVKRVYEPPEPADGARFLVERFWPRGMNKASLAMQAWLKELAPGDELRRWFGHQPEKWAEFRKRYFAELDSRPEALQPLLEALGRGDVTLLYSARENEYNNAVALKKYIEEQFA